MSDRPPDQGICKCGLAWSYHDGRLKTWDEYEPRYTPPADAPSAPDLRAAAHEPHHLGYPVSGKTGTYDAAVVMVKRDWYERLLALIDAHHCYDEAALADATAGLHNFAMAAGDVEHQGAWWHCNAEPCKSYAARLRP